MDNGGYMRRLMSHPLRVVTIAAVVIPASLATVALAGSTAWASVATCSKLSGPNAAGNALIAGCNDTANTGGSGTAPVSAFAGGSGTITWATGHGTTPVTLTFTAVGGSGQPKDETETKKCAAGSQEYVIVGKTGTSTGKAASIPPGSKVSAEVCVVSSPALKFSLEPGTKMII
jgi:hypothetical protein